MIKKVKTMSDVMEELIDVLNEDGTKTGLSATKEEIYQKGYWYRSVHIWIINDKHELLMQKRNPHKKTFPNLWALSVAGHVLANETSIDTGIREAKEELDLDIKPEYLEYLFTIKREQPYKENSLKVFDDVYLLPWNVDIEHTKLQVEELTDIKYVYYEYLQTMLENNDPEYVPMTEENQKLYEILKNRFK